MTVEITDDLAVPDDRQIKNISQLATELVEIETELALLSNKAAKLAERHRTISEQVLPDAMMSAGIEKLSLSDGAVITLGEDMSISVPKKNMGKVCDWLRDNNHGDIIKNNFVVPVPKGKGSEEQVEKLQRHLLAMKLEFSHEESVHSGTLKALLKEQRKKGVELNLSMFGAYEWRKVVVDLPM